MAEDQLNQEEVTEEMVNIYENYDIVVDPKQQPLRIDKLLIDRLPKVSRSKIQTAIKAGNIKVNEKEIKPNFKVKPGDRISIVFLKPFREEEGIQPEDIPLDIRYEDDAVMVIHKPAGLVVHPGVGNRNGTLVNALAYYFKNKALPVMEGNDQTRPGLVHRIDKDTTGLMVIAKTEEAMTHLAKQFFSHSIERTYQALIWGEFEETEGTIEVNVGRDDKNFRRRKAFRENEDGKHAITHYKTLEPLYYVSLIECKLETGRTHQIRVHMKYKGHPLFGDTLYGGDRVVKGTVFTKYRLFVENTFKLLPRQALHAKSIGFVHPTTGEKMFFESDLPADFTAVLERWRKYVSTRKDK